MSSTIAPQIITYLADGAIAKGSAVKIGSDKNHVAIGAANTNRCIGIAQVATTAAEDAIEVAVDGGAKALLGEACSAGDFLVSHTDGTLVLLNASGDNVIAKALESGSIGDLISVKMVDFQAAAAN